MKPVYLLLFAALAGFSALHAQTIDSSFHAPIIKRWATIQTIKAQNNGKILLGGSIDFYQSTSVNNLIRLNSDGSLDTTFNFKHSGSFLVMDVEILSTGDIVILTRGYEAKLAALRIEGSILYLDANGSVKHEDDSLSFANAIAVQSDDKVLVCSAHAAPRPYLYRYNTDYSSDQAFNGQVSFDSFPLNVQVNLDKVFVVGEFTKVNGVPKNGIVKLNLDGSIDDTFDTGSGTTVQAGSLTFQDDGKILNGGSQIYSHGLSTFGIIRLNSDGSPDTLFRPPFIYSGASEVLMSGTDMFMTAPLLWSDRQKLFLFRLHQDGSLDQDFTPVEIKGFDIRDFHMAFSNGNLIFNNSMLSGSLYGLSSIDLQGNQIDSFDPEVTQFGVIVAGDYLNEKLIVAGDFIKIDTLLTNGIARLNNDGSVDASFAPVTKPGVVRQIRVLDSGGVLVSTSYDLYELDSQGKIQPDFQFVHFGTLYEIIKFIVLPNGKIMAGDANNLYRLNANGTQDLTFDIGGGIEGYRSDAFDFDMQSDETIYGSMFTGFNGTPVNRLVRLSPSGAVDPTFNYGTGPNDQISMVKVLASGEIVLGGTFTEFDGRNIPHGLVKLSVNGSVDGTFLANQAFAFGTNISLLRVKVELLGSRILIKGDQGVYVLNSDGTDSVFMIPAEVDFLNDIVIAGTGTSVGRAKGRNESSGDFMFALGSFHKADQSAPSFVIKVNMGRQGLVTGLPEAGNSLPVTIYPNPAHESLNIHFKDPDSSYDIAIYDLSGRQVLQLHGSEVNRNDIREIDVQSVEPGLYIMKLTSGLGRTDYIKFVKSK